MADDWSTINKFFSSAGIKVATSEKDRLTIIEYRISELFTKVEKLEKLILKEKEEDNNGRGNKKISGRD